MEDYLVLTIDGTTFSGDPIATTFGNTWRSGMYFKYMAFKAFGDDYNKYIDLIVAGDDVLCFCDKDKLHLYLAVIKSLTVDSRPDVCVTKGLGQIVKQLIISDTEFDFNSRWVFNKSGKIYVTRDFSKLLLQKQAYTKNNSQMLAHPALHRAAILLSLMAEGASRLLEAIVFVQVREFVTYDEATNSIRGDIP